MTRDASSGDDDQPPTASMAPDAIAPAAADVAPELFPAPNRE